MASTANQISYEEAKRKARYGHRDWVFWTSRDGTSLGAPASRESIKAALLDLGTGIRFQIIGASTGIGHLHRWRDGCRMMRNAKHIWGRS